MRSCSVPSRVSSVRSPVTVAPGGPLAVALVTPGADQPLDIGLHQQLQHRLSHGSQKISLTSLLQQLGQYQSLFGRVRRDARGAQPVLLRGPGLNFRLCVSKDARTDG